MGKRFVTRSRLEWEGLLAPQAESDEASASAKRWLSSRLEGYVQSTQDAPVTLAVPDRFLETLGDVAETTSSAARDGQPPAGRRERGVR